MRWRGFVWHRPPPLKAGMTRWVKRFAWFPTDLNDPARTRVWLGWFCIKQETAPERWLDCGGGGGWILETREMTPEEKEKWRNWDWYEVKRQLKEV